MALVIPLVICFAVSYLVATTLYSLFFHPLASTPGPFLCRISSLPSFYHACKGDRHIWIWQNFQIYGDKFRAAPNLILFNSTDAYSDIYGARANVHRSSFYKTWQRNEDDHHTMCAPTPEEHAKRRKALNLIFTETSMKAASPLIAYHTDRWVHLISGSADNDSLAGARSASPDSGGWSQPRNMANWTQHLTFDILGDLCFGASLNTKEPGKSAFKTVPTSIMEIVAMGYKLSKSPFFDILLFMQTRGLSGLKQRLLKQNMKDYTTFTETTVDNRIAAHKEGKRAEGDRKDMFYFLLTAIDPDTKRPAYSTRNKLLSESRLLIIAGSDTSSTVMTSVFFYLAHNTRTLAKLKHEVRSTFAKSSDIKIGSKLSGCKYLRACIDESLRMTHPVPSEMSRVVLPGGAIIDGTFYPPGTIVGCTGWSMGRDERGYGDAHTFRPERWIADEYHSEADIRKLRMDFHPFSMGRMNCAGQNLALLELTMTVAKTVWATEFRLAPGFTVGEGDPSLGWGQRNQGEYMVTDAYLCSKDGPMLQFRPRLTQQEVTTAL